MTLACVRIWRPGRALYGVFEFKNEHGARLAGRAVPDIMEKKAMGYVEKVLQDSEVVRKKGKIHWIIYARGFVLLILGVVTASVVNAADPSRHPAFLIAGFFFVFGGLSLLSAWFIRVTTEIAVTDRRIIYKKGFISRKTLEMNMTKVESVDVDQSVLGRILNYGTLTVRGTGAGMEPLKRVAAPLELRNMVTAQ